MPGTRLSARREGGQFLQALGCFGRSVEGIAALEFALLAPLMIYTILVGFDLATALLISRRLSNAADVVAELVSQQTDSSGNPTGSSLTTDPITNTLLLGDFFSVVTTFPDVLADAATKGDEPWQYDIEVIASEVEFGPETGNGALCVVPSGANLLSARPPTPNCTTANVVWSAGFTARTSAFTSTRACGLNTLTITKSTAAVSSPSLAAMPHYLYQPGDLIVVDIFYKFTPMFTKWIIGSYTFERAAYIVPRFFTKLAYSPPGSQVAGVNTFPNTGTGSDGTGISSCTFSGTIP